MKCAVIPVCVCLLFSLFIKSLRNTDYCFNVTWRVAVAVRYQHNLSRVCGRCLKTHPSSSHLTLPHLTHTHSNSHAHPHTVYSFSFIFSTAVSNHYKTDRAHLKIKADCATLLCSAFAVSFHWGVILPQEAIKLGLKNGTKDRLPFLHLSISWPMMILFSMCNSSHSSVTLQSYQTMKFGQVCNNTGNKSCIVVYWYIYIVAFSSGFTDEHKKKTNIL